MGFHVFLGLIKQKDQLKRPNQNYFRQDRSPIIDTRLQRDFPIIQKKLNIRQCQLSIWREKWFSSRVSREFKFTGSGKLF